VIIKRLAFYNLRYCSGRISAFETKDKNALRNAILLI